ncbi:MAG TPA: sigma-70 family RNA polymerase sigma factor [Verrucomicrobiales bacterium]|nr:sigma-70 family RNA polymerase sigma factor [Verrucomicrobiales bacterium]
MGRKLDIAAAETGPEDAGSLVTRASLMSRLQDWENQEGWREFFTGYWRLIYNFACRAGLGDADAQDVVQETMLAVSKAMPGFRYDRSKGRFRSWLMTVVRTRLANHWERLGRRQRLEAAAEERVPDEKASDLEKCWEEEWTVRVVSGALERLRQRIQGRQFLFFDMVERQGIAMDKAAAATGFNVAHGYVIRHRLRRMLRTEVKRLEND